MSNNFFFFKWNANIIHKFFSLNFTNTFVLIMLWLILIKKKIFKITNISVQVTSINKFYSDLFVLIFSKTI